MLQVFEVFDDHVERVLATEQAAEAGFDLHEYSILLLDVLKQKFLLMKLEHIFVHLFGTHLE